MAVGRDLYVIGGANSDSRSLADVDILRGEIFSRAPPLPVPVSMASAGTYDNSKIYVCGGRDMTCRATNVVQVFDVKARKWKLVETGGAKPPPVYGHQVVVMRDQLFLVGGWTPSTGNYLSTIFCLDLTNHRWREVGELSSARSGHIAFAVGSSHLFIHGGTTPHGVVGTTEYFDISQGKRATDKQLQRGFEKSLGARTDHCVACYGSDGKEVVIVFGGVNAKDELSSELAVFVINAEFGASGETEGQGGGGEGWLEWLLGGAEGGVSGASGDSAESGGEVEERGGRGRGGRGRSRVEESDHPYEDSGGYASDERKKVVKVKMSLKGKKRR